MIASTALSFMFSVSTLSFDKPTFVSRSSLSPFLTPVNLKSNSLGLSMICISMNKLVPSSLVNKIWTSETRLCFHSFAIALPNTSVPGICTLSPTARPDIEMIKFWSNDFEPVTLISAMVYSFGTLELKISCSAGLIETAGLSIIWAFISWLENNKTTIKKVFW